MTTDGTAEKGLPQPIGRPQGGMKSGAARSAYWRMNYESAIQALADLIAENTENVEFARDFYSHNSDLMNDYWRTRWTKVFPPAGCDDPDCDNHCTVCGKCIMWGSRCHAHPTTPLPPAGGGTR